MNKWRMARARTLRQRIVNDWNIGRKIVSGCASVYRCELVAYFLQSPSGAA